MSNSTLPESIPPKTIPRKSVTPGAPLQASIPPRSKQESRAEARKREAASLQSSWSIPSDYRAWIGSTALHTFLVVMIALLFRPVSNGTGGEVTERIGLSLAHGSDTGEDSEAQGGGNDGQASDEAINAAAQNLNMGASDSATTDLDALMTDNMGALANALNGVQVTGDGTSMVGTPGLGNGDGSASGDNGRGNGSGGKTKSSFMGIEGEGNSFVYVVDYSDSMSAYSGRPMSRAKNELAYSIQTLGRVNQFQIIFYNDQPSRYAGLLGSPGKLLFANDNEKDAVAQYVRNITPAGGTEHFNPLMNALAMHPDVVFFLTDGADPSLSQDQIERVVASAQRNRATIHAIQFGDGTDSGAGHWIKQIAERTGGKSRYVDVSAMAEK